MITIKELRKPRIFGIALFDLILAFIGMALLFLGLWKWHFPKLNPWSFVIRGMILAIPVGIFMHVLFGVNTEFNYYLGLSYKPT
jgi:hypothetical protein